MAISEESDERELFRMGISLFNRGEFFECHEVLEDLWNLQVDPEKQLTQGLIQIAVGYYHLLRHNHLGAGKLFTRGLQRILPFCPEHNALGLNEVRCAVERDLKRLQTDTSHWIPDLPKLSPEPEE